MISEAAIPATGAAIVLQNTEKLGLPAYVPDGTEAIPSFASSSAQEVLRNKKRPPHVYTGVPPPLPPSSGSQRSYGFESLARGFMERAQASGIDKTILSTVSEIKKNFNGQTVPSFPFRGIGSDPTMLPPPDQALSTVEGMNIRGLSLQDPAPIISAPPPRTLLDTEREIAELRLVMIGMGKAMGSCMDVIRRNDRAAQRAAAATATTKAAQGSSEAAHEQRAQSSERAWVGLQRLQESLLDGGAASTSDLARDWAWSHDLQTNGDIPGSPLSPIHTATMVGGGGQHHRRTSSGLNRVTMPPAPSYPIGSPTFNAPRNQRPSDAHRFVVPPHSTGTVNDSSKAHGPRHQISSTAPMLPNTLQQSFAAPPLSASVQHLSSSRRGDLDDTQAFEIPTSDEYQDTIDLEPRKKPINVDPLLGVGV